MQGPIWEGYRAPRAQRGWLRLWEQRAEEGQQAVRASDIKRREIIAAYERDLAAVKEGSRRSAARHQQLLSASNKRCSSLLIHSKQQQAHCRRLQREMQRSKAAAAAAQDKTSRMILSLRAHVSQLQQEKEAAIRVGNGAIAGLQADNARLEQQLAALQETAAASQAAAEAATKAYDMIEEESATLRLDLAAAEATAAAATAAEVRANTALVNLQQQLQHVETDAATRVEDLEKDKAALEKRVGELEAGVAAREEDKAALEAKVGECEARVAAGEAEVILLKSQLESAAAADSAATPAESAAEAYAATDSTLSWLKEMTPKYNSQMTKHQLQLQHKEARGRCPRGSNDSTISNISSYSSSTSSSTSTISSNTTTSSSSLNGSKCSWPSSSPHSSSSSKGVSQAGTRKAPGALTDAEAGADGALAGIVARKHHSSVYKPERLKGGGKPQVRQQGQAAGCLRRENALRGNGHCS
jgi:hypothetical protein